MEPQLKTVNNYYQEKSQNNLRIKEFDTTNSVKLPRDISRLLIIQREVMKMVNKDNLAVHKDKSAAFKFAHLEYLIEKKYKQLVAFYLAKGIKANPKYFKMLEHDRSDKAGLKFMELVYKVRCETKSTIEEDKALNHNILEKNITREKLYDIVELAERK
jgi:hypothetical protein